MGKLTPAKPKLKTVPIASMGCNLQEVQRPSHPKASNDLQLPHVPTITASQAISNQDPTSPTLQWLNADISTAAATAQQAVTVAAETSSKQLPAEDVSASGLDKKRQVVVEAAAHSWRGYEEHAWGSDELQPLTQDGKESLGGFGATIVDSLDTLWLMGLKDQFGRSA